jgi:Fe2+ or Zn2+ uptake regulation protein
MPLPQPEMPGPVRGPLRGARNPDDAAGDHIHIAGLRSRKIMEFVSDIFETLKGHVEKDRRFRIVVSRLEIGGYCAACCK